MALPIVIAQYGASKLTDQHDEYASKVIIKGTDGSDRSLSARQSEEWCRKVHSEWNPNFYDNWRGRDKENRIKQCVQYIQDNTLKDPNGFGVRAYYAVGNKTTGYSEQYIKDKIDLANARSYFKAQTSLPEPTDLPKTLADKMTFSYFVANNITLVAVGGLVGFILPLVFVQIITPDLPFAFKMIPCVAGAAGVVFLEYQVYKKYEGVFGTGDNDKGFLGKLATTFSLGFA